MIPLEQIRKLRTLITHGYPNGPCPDGLASALILRHALPQLEVRFLVTGSRELAELPAEPGIVFCDITPPAARAEEFVETGAIVLDHHVSARDVVAKFGERGVYADLEREPGVSGAMLAFREIWLPLSPGGRGENEDGDTLVEVFFRDTRDRIRAFAALTGVRDTWQRSSPGWTEACEQMAALLFYPDWLEVNDGVTGALGMPDLFRQRMVIGKVLREKSEADARSLAKQAYPFTTTQGTRVAILPSCRISDATDLLPGVDVVAGFQFTAGEGEAPAMRVSLRARAEHDVSRMASSLGGGGHKGAAGMSIRLAVEDLQPYAALERAIEAYEKRDDTPWGLVRKGQTS